MKRERLAAVPASDMIFTCPCTGWTPSEPSYSFLCPAVVCSTHRPRPQTLCPRSQRRPASTQQNASPPDRPSARTPASLWNKRHDDDRLSGFWRSFSQNVVSIITFQQTQYREVTIHIQRALQWWTLVRHTMDSLNYYHCVAFEKAEWSDMNNGQKKPLALFFYEQLSSPLCTCPAESPPSQSFEGRREKHM